MSIKDKIRDKMLQLGLAAATLSPTVAPNANAATPEAPEQPKTEQAAPSQEGNNDGKTIKFNGFSLTPVDEVPGSNRQQSSPQRTSTRRQTAQRQVASQQARTTKNVRYGSPEWAEMNGWVYDAQLSNGLNRLGADDGSHNGYLGAYYKIDDPEKIMFLPNDPIHDKLEFAHRGNAKASQWDNTSQYSHHNHDPKGYGCPDQKITTRRVGHILHNITRIRGHRGGR